MSEHVELKNCSLLAKSRLVLSHENVLGLCCSLRGNIIFITFRCVVVKSNKVYSSINNFSI